MSIFKWDVALFLTQKTPTSHLSTIFLCSEVTQTLQTVLPQILLLIQHLTITLASKPATYKHFYVHLECCIPNTVIIQHIPSDQRKASILVYDISRLEYRSPLRVKLDFWFQLWQTNQLVPKLINAIHSVSTRQCRLHRYNFCKYRNLPSLLFY